MVIVRHVGDGEWITVDRNERVDSDLYLDGKLKAKLDLGKKQQKKDFDVGGLVVGDEGSGKSHQASNIMIYMTDGRFDPNKHIIKTHEDAITVLEEVEDGGGIMFDEGYLLFYSGDVLTRNQKAITKIFSIIRQKNLFFLIVAPSFFRMSTYFGLDRTKFLIRVYEKGFERGFFEFYGKRRKQKLFDLGKPKHNYSLVRPAFRGRFSQCKLLDEVYTDVKKETLRKAFEEAKLITGPKQTKRDIIRKHKLEILKNLINKGGMTRREMGELLGVSERTINNYKDEITVLTS